MATKYYDQEIASVAANATVQQFASTFPDGWQDVVITGIYSPTTTARWSFGIMIQGKQLLTVAAPIFAAGNPRVKTDLRVPAQAGITLTVQDATGSGASNVHFVIEYTCATQ